MGENVGWRWVAAFIAIFTGVITVIGATIIPETYAPVPLRQRAATLSKATGNVYRSKYEKDGRVDFSQMCKTALGRPRLLLLTEPIVFLLTVYLGLV